MRTEFVCISVLRVASGLQGRLMIDGGLDESW